VSAERTYERTRGIVDRVRGFAAGLPWSRVERRGDALVKTRLPHARVLRRLCSRLALRVEILWGERWLDRERALYQTLYGATVERAGDDALRLPLLPGETLAALLGRTRAWTGGAAEAMRAAWRALRVLHGLDEEAHGSRRSFSHADATVANVLVDATGAARFIDFESVHAERLGAVERRADDLRALVVSAAAALGGGSGELIAFARAAAAEAGLSAALRAVMRSTAHDPIHLAQCPLAPDDRDALVAALAAD
jgi:hypothetical protein